MAGIYIHIPFCKQACYYCNFHFSTSAKNYSAFINCIVKEANLQKNYLKEKVETIYLGGGTPSLITIADLQNMMEHLKKIFDVTDDAEITLEANPDDITEQKLINWKSIGVNRLSIGVQSFYDKDLQWINRIHTAAHAMHCLELATKYFKNISIDLIYGIPTLSNKQWKENIKKTLSFSIPHISCYALTVEPKTALNTLIHQNKKENINAEIQAEQFNILITQLQNAGFEHYEISNFAKPSYKSKHNSNYWKSKPYLGLGPSAHSFNVNSRQWNIANNALYIKSIEQNNVPFEIEYLTETQQLNEWLMIGLRTSEGINFFDDRWKLTTDEIKNKILFEAKKWEATNQVIISASGIQLTDKGKFFADGIAASLFQ